MKKHRQIRFNCISNHIADLQRSFVWIIQSCHCSVIQNADGPEGVYVRQGYSSVPATNTAIRRMIKETDGDHFEEMRSLEQKLTFKSAKKIFAERNVKSLTAVSG